MPAAFLSIKKLTGAGIVKVAASHNLREIAAELSGGHIDQRRSSFNQVLAGPHTAAEVAALAEVAMTEAGVGKLRRDAVRALELVVSVQRGSANDAFFEDALGWMLEYFKCPAVNAVVHHDEAEVHLHVILVPIVGNRMIGSKIVGDRRRLQEMQSAFFERVGKMHGLSRPEQSRRKSEAEKTRIGELVVSALRDNPALLNLPNVRHELGLLVGQSSTANPVALLAAMGLDTPKQKTKKQRSLVNLMISPRPERKQNKYPREQVAGEQVTVGVTLEDSRLKSIDFAPDTQPKSIDFAPADERSLPLCRLPKSTAPKPQSEPPVEHEPESELDQLLGSAIADHAESVDESWQRVRDNEPGQVWDGATGEFIPLPIKRPGRDRQAAITEVSRLPRGLPTKRHKELHVRF